ncbi:MAG TPA: hypothetical protein DCE41_32660 [Cytophagales bacterium]|nr:hypothetical protein [Cytophagales bacterium]HAA24369.1 hypothetical protein [Cytophagales bacterium]HAP64433.1 hypothetical protein [Cytophagales bacterium]
MAKTLHPCKQDFKKEADAALAFFPELANTPVRFEYSHISVQSFMLAQPVVNLRFFSKRHRQYRIRIKKSLVVNEEQYSEKYPRHEVLVGWLGHELGHILDYKDRSAFNLMMFGLRYHFFPAFLKKAEITADKNAVREGLVNHLLLSKAYGREPSVFSKSYIKKLNQLYPSLEEVRGWAKDKGLMVNSN